MSHYIAMNRFKIVKGQESEFEEIWETGRQTGRHADRQTDLPHHFCPKISKRPNRKPENAGKSNENRITFQ